MLKYFAQRTITLPPIRGEGPLGLVGPKGEDLLSQAPVILQNVISAAIGLFIGVGVIWFIFQFISGAFQWLTSSGDPKSIEGARNKISAAIIGLVIMLAALAIISLMGTVLGLDFLNIRDFIQRLTSGAPDGTQQGGGR